MRRENKAAGRFQHKYRIAEGKHAKLPKPEDKSAFDGDKEMALALLENLGERMARLQVDLYAENRRKLLVVLQGLDSSGKDGTIHHVFRQVNPQGVRVASFKRPTDEEASHDFLWRIHKEAPRAGQIGVFNRSHYEDVVTTRVRKLVPKEVWTRRHEAINDFERMLTQEGTTVLKFFLHISRDEQAERLRERLEDPDKRWKFNPGDLDDRKLWPEYEKAYAETLARTSTDWAPWYAVPANSRWYRNLMVATIVVDALEGMKLKRPKQDFDPKAFVIK
jgi:PPK2 family polyphosphate:nucleotide phosphotransferase